MRSSLSWRGLAGPALAALPLLLAGCQLPATGVRPHASLEPLWKDYQKLAHTRALVVAGDPERPNWVAAMAGGAARRSEAVEAATDECRRKRQERRMRAPCLVYAVDDEIVWQR
jgi:hypothetical protein